MMMAREHFAAAEADSTLRKALKQRIYTDPVRVSVGDWVYFRRNLDRYWKGPAKVVLKDSKSLHCVMRGNPLIINSDDILLNKPNAQEIELEDLISLPASQQPPVTTISEQPLQPEPEVEITQPDLTLDVPPSVDISNASVPQIYDAQRESGLVLQEGNEATSQEIPGSLSSTPSLSVVPTPAPAVQNCDAQNESEMVLQDDARIITQDNENPPSHHHQPVPSTTVEHRAISSL